MDSTQRGMILLMKSAITGQKFTFPGDFSLQESLPISDKHQLGPLLYIGSVNCGVDPQHPAVTELLNRYCTHMLYSEKQMSEFRRICRCFQENGIDFLPLKGCIMKARYPKPELRSMGDADILIRMEQYDRIIPLMESLGFTRGIETDNELVWDSKKLHLELHRWLVPSFDKDYFAYFRDSWHRAKPTVGTQYGMTPEDEFLFLLAHFAKHYRNGGIGCRHVLDLYVFLRCFPDLDQAYVESELNRLNLLTFYRNLRRLLAYWFEDGAADPASDYITDYIFSGGSWGLKKHHLVSYEIKGSKPPSSTQMVRFRAWFRVFFPRRQDLRDLYPIVDRHPWLTPGVWVWRWVDVILHRSDRLAKRAGTMQMMNDDNITEFQRALRYMGLELPQ